MGLVSANYETLAPRGEYLRDVVVLAQAWKKAHTYIRRYNWYADTLELDCSAVSLDLRLDQWSASLEDGTYQPQPAWLVPAPKNEPWKFDPRLPDGWGPRSGASQDFFKSSVLRPLAHIGIREQTVATTLLLCLADCVESAQGDPALHMEAASASRVRSYGNRLFCNWSSDGRTARYPWGNSTTYSRYFQDYQQFVARPNAIARRTALRITNSELIYIVKLDLAAFFDNIDVDFLVDGLKSEYERFREANPSRAPADDEFWDLAKTALNIGWRPDDQHLAELLRDRRLPNGLPQGLVAGGFFANAYLLNFDRAMGELANGYEMPLASASTVVIHDFCRYVDDIRIVVAVRGADATEAEISRAVAALVQGKLVATTSQRADSRLDINPSKTEVELFSAIGGDSATAARMKALQQQLSGPFDVATLQYVETGLNGLLSQAELGLIEDTSPPEESSLPRLASVAQSKLEVRDDTLTRFSAYRLTKALRMRRSMTDLTEPREEGSEKDALLRDFESVARRLVAAWAVNPSLVQVLRYALDLFPSPTLLAPIADALTLKLNAVSEFERRVAYYVLAELFKAGAMETGRRAETDDAFKAGDLAFYRRDLADLAMRTLVLYPVPWYVQQQAALLLGSLGQHIDSIDDGPELRLYVALHEFLRQRNDSRTLSVPDEVAVSLVGYQLTRDSARYFSWFRRFASGRRRAEIAEAIQILAPIHQELVAEITGRNRRTAAGTVPAYVRRYLELQLASLSGELPVDTWVSLATVMTHGRETFEQENALLQLALALVKLIRNGEHDPESLNPLSIQARCADWRSLNDPRHQRLTLRVLKSAPHGDPLYKTPPWCRSDHAWMYAIGRLLRSAATGELDFTTRHWLLREEPGWYRGIRSTWQKRRMGLLSSSSALGGSMAAITPWFSSLLLSLLRWPGIAIELESAVDQIETTAAFEALIRERLQSQAEIYGTSSDLPIYRYPVPWRLRGDRSLRIALVQGLMPQQRDFKDGFAGLDVAGYRERHRNHTASLLHLVHRHLATRDSVLGKDRKPYVDLVVLPEYTVHVRDQDLMRAFSDATGAMLFYGLMGATDAGGRRINAARWLAPERRHGRRAWIEVDQGKFHITDDEVKLGVTSWRPYQVVMSLRFGADPAFRLAGAICYDATDLALAADLKDESHMFLVPAMNKDVKTFDSMVGALRYHMYQHVLIVNCGEFGGSTAQAPYDEEHRRLVSHVHGNAQIAVSIFDVCIDDFGPKLIAAEPATTVTKAVTERLGKTPPAGLARKPL